MVAFNYPESPHTRRHGPQGYSDYSSFRPWLRDEFTFRCVYCLMREQWGKETGEFDLDHFHPQATNSESGRDYGNLLYACARCNGAKGAQDVDDPCTEFVLGKIRVLPDGTLEVDSLKGRKIVQKLCLNSERSKLWRRIWMRNVELAEQYDRDQYLRLMGFPEDLPNLSRLKPPEGNTRPNGIDECYYALKQRGELPETY